MEQCALSAIARMATAGNALSMVLSIRDEFDCPVRSIRERFAVAGVSQDPGLLVTFGRG